MASDIHIIFAPQPGQSKRERELQASFARSHAARVCSAKGVQTLWAKKAIKSNERREGLARADQQQRRHEVLLEQPADVSWPQEALIVMPELPRPQNLLGQGQVDPVNADPLRKLPSIARKSLEYAILAIWPSTTPMVDKAALNRQITEWRTLAVQSPLEFHTQVSTATSLCYSLSKDPRVMQDLLLTRWKHQSTALKLVREVIGSLKGLPSESLIDCLDRLAAQGGRLYTAGSVRQYRETPIADVLPLKMYGRFEPCRPHFEALKFLIRQKGGYHALSPGVSKPLSMADTAVSSKWERRPMWPLHRDYRIASDSPQFQFDPQAARLRLAMGTGWIALQRNHQKIVDLAFRAADLTVALDQTCRGGTGCLTLAQISLLAFVFQYDLCDLNPPTESPQTFSGGSDQLFMICLLALQIYSDVVLFPIAETYGIRPRRARQLQTALISYSATRKLATDHLYRELILWAAIMGAVSSEATRHREWYLRQIMNIIVEKKLTWDSLKDCLLRFLWWDHTFDEHVRAIWKDAWATANDEDFRALTLGEEASPAILDEIGSV